MRRSVTQKNPHLHLKFDAHDRQFHIRLRRDITTFSDNLQVVTTDELPVAFDVSHVYEGRLVDDPHSVVHGSVIDGVFEGKIVTERDTFFVEHAKHYFPEIKNGSRRTDALDRFKYSVEGEETEKADQEDNVAVKLDFHSVIYKDEHVDDPYAHKRKGHVSGCGITEEVQSWMDQIQNSAVVEAEGKEEEAPVGSVNSNEQLRDNKKQQQALKKYLRNKKVKNSSAEREELGEFPLPYQKYSKEANEVNGEEDGAEDQKEDWHKEAHERVKRAARPREENKNTCSLYIQTDPLIWRHIREGIIEVRLEYEM